MDISVLSIDNVTKLLSWGIYSTRIKAVSISSQRQFFKSYKRIGSAVRMNILYSDLMKIKYIDIKLVICQDILGCTFILGLIHIVNWTIGISVRYTCDFNIVV